jgi:hypothetical protein
MGNCYSCKKQLEHCFYIFEKYYTISLEQRYVNNSIEIEPLVTNDIVETQYKKTIQIEDDIEAQYKKTIQIEDDIEAQYKKTINSLQLDDNIETQYKKTIQIEDDVEAQYKKTIQNKTDDDLFDDFEII